MTREKGWVVPPQYPSPVTVAPEVEARSGPTSKAPLLIPDRITVAAALQEALEGNYQSVHVSLEPCPDLRTWGAAAKGLGGSTRLVELGGEAFMHNPRFNGRGTYGTHHSIYPLYTFITLIVTPRTPVITCIYTTYTRNTTLNTL